MHKIVLASLALSTLLACGKADTTPATSYSESDLTRYKAALPTADQLTATTPTATTKAAATSDFPQIAKDATKGINGVVTGIVELMRAIVDLPPTVYNSDTHEFVWGPWNNDSGYGNVLVYIKEQLPEAKPAAGCPADGWSEKPTGTCTPDFHFVYALARGLGNDMATYTPVIWGGANPDATNGMFGTGITLWDFEANYAWSVAHDPAYATEQLARGRFVAVYGKGADTGGATFAFNVAVFANFVPQETPGAAGIDAEYYFGSYRTPSLGLTFVNFLTQADVDHDANGDPENLDVRIAFLDSGVGRAEATISCPANTTCSLPGPTGAVGQATECWDGALGKVYSNLTYNGVSLSTQPPGATMADCGSPFSASLDSLNIPSRGDLDPVMMQKLHDVAENGMPTGN